MAQTAVILQVRLASTRLPGKLLLPLSGKSILEHILLRLSAARTPESIIIATTADTAPRIGELAGQYSAYIHLGSEEDVLLRYVEACGVHHVETVIRATGDNPLVCIPYIDEAVMLHGESGSDLTLFPELPYGTGVEVIDAAVLHEMHRATDDPFEREHITQYLYRHESAYRITRGVPEEDLRRPDLRLTVDTPEDYGRMCSIYEALYRGTPIDLHEVIRYLEKG
jgi:spore coat polysaccharide biosynthesis protein SpsF